MRDKNTIINRMVYDTSDIMEAKAESDEMIADMLEEKRGAEDETVLILRSRCVETRKAVKLIRDNEGCWA